MVSVTAPAATTPAYFARSSVAAAPLDRLSQRPQPTRAQADALAALDVVHSETKEAPRKAAAAKVDHLRSKLSGVQLAAGSASATGDLGLARTTTRDVRAITKELTQALEDAGLLKEAVTVPGEKSPGEAKRGGKRDTDLGQASEDGEEIVDELRKVVAKLRMAAVAARVRGASPEEIKQVETALRDGEKELGALSGALNAKPSGRTVDLDA